MSTEGFALIRYDAMCLAIDNAFEVDEVKDLRDKAMAFEAYSRQARNTEAERRACEIRLRAERKAGSLLSTMEKAAGGGDTRMPKEHRSHGGTGAKTLSDLGISKHQSHRWQQLAGVPQAQFEAALAAPDKPTTNGILATAQKRSPMDPNALWLWGRLRDFERDGIFDTDPKDLLEEMTDAMRADVRRLVPLLLDWLERIVQ